MTFLVNDGTFSSTGREGRDSISTQLLDRIGAWLSHNRTQLLRGLLVLVIVIGFLPTPVKAYGTEIPVPSPKLTCQFVYFVTCDVYKPQEKLALQPVPPKVETPVHATPTITAKPAVKPVNGALKGLEPTTGSPSLSSNSLPSNMSHNQLMALTQQILAQRGLSAEWTDLDWLITTESGWNINAVEPHTGACGLVQANPCSKIASIRYDATGQINWIIDYCQNRYGGISQAVTFHRLHNWY